MDLQSIDQAIELHYAARKYILPILVPKCVQYIQNNITPDHTCRVLEFSKLFDEDILKVKFKSIMNRVGYIRTEDIRTSDIRTKK